CGQLSTENIVVAAPLEATSCGPLRLGNRPAKSERIRRKRYHAEPKDAGCVSTSRSFPEATPGDLRRRGDIVVERLDRCLERIVLRGVELGVGKRLTIDD